MTDRAARPARPYRRPVRVVRVRKFCANTRFANRRAPAIGFVPRVPLEDALRATIRHEFGAPARPGPGEPRVRSGIGRAGKTIEKAVSIRSR